MSMPPPLVPQRPSAAAGPALIAASWPSASAAVDTGALHQFAALKAVVRGIRNARAEYAVTPGRRIAATVVVPADPALRSPPPPHPLSVLFLPCNCLCPHKCRLTLRIDLAGRAC